MYLSASSNQGRNLALTTGEGGGVESFCPAKGRGLHQMLYKRVWPAIQLL